MKLLRGGLLTAAITCWSPAAFAQGAIGGTVRDTSGARLPGVTVEAVSPALIERSRTVVTDTQGQYKIVDLRPGTYKVTLTLPGFAAVSREGLELTTGVTLPVNAEMSVAQVQETITVTGDTPVVDVQNTRQASVVGREVLDAIPRSRDQALTAAPGTLFGDRKYQVDLRCGKTIQAGRLKLAPALDFYNLLNASPVLSENFTYGPIWRQPTDVLTGQVIQAVLQVNF